jgi:hypothetical protein
VISRWRKPVDLAPLAAFRIMLGLIMAAEGFGAIATGWVRRNFVDPEFTFNFIGFDFLQVFVGPQFYFLYVLLGLSGLGIALGYRYRLSVLIYTLVWSISYFGQKTSYNNHYYLLWIICFILFLVPAHRYASLDVRQGRVAKAERTPYLNIWIFKILLLIVYTYAAIAKLYPDWLEGTPVRIFLSGKADMPLIGPLVHKDWMIYLIAYGGILFDFLIIPGLWYRKTRNFAFGVAIFFHLFNSIVFKIGIFPYMMLASAVLFYPAPKMRRLFFRNEIPENAPVTGEVQKPVGVFFTVLLILMVLLPLRPFYYPGSSHWTEEAHRLSWHMMLRSKSGYCRFIVSYDDGRKDVIMPQKRMSDKMARKMATHPDMLWQYARRLRKEYELKGHTDVQVYARAYASLNGRRYYPLVDPNRDLSREKWSHFHPHDWILPNPELEKTD